MRYRLGQIPILLLISTMAIAFVGGRGLHLLIGCDYAGCSLQCQHERQFVQRCTCPHHDESSEKPGSSDQKHDHVCSFCDFLALSKEAVAIAIWQPDIDSFKQENQVFSFFIVSVYRGFAFSRAPPGILPAHF